ncbi:MAG: hypothetical protein HKN23_08535 [Verrucomicrobiales bacterium]|nr:hypothetical protein [Verrucomicrobiales bacterium]
MRNRDQVLPGAPNFSHAGEAGAVVGSYLGSVKSLLEDMLDVLFVSLMFWVNATIGVGWYLVQRWRETRYLRRKYGIIHPVALT